MQTTNIRHRDAGEACAQAITSDLKCHWLPNNNRPQSKHFGIIFELAAKSIHAPLEQMPVIIKEALAEIGLYLSADRVYIWPYRLVPKTVDNICEWRRQADQPGLADATQSPLARAATQVARHSQGRPVVIHDTATEAPPTLRAHLCAATVKSLMTYPLHSQNRPIGCIGVWWEACHRHIAKCDLEILAHLSHILVALKHRAKAEARCQQQRHKMVVKATHLEARLMQVKHARKQEAKENAELRTALKIFLEGRAVHRAPAEAVCRRNDRTDRLRK